MNSHRRLYPALLAGIFFGTAAGLLAAATDPRDTRPLKIIQPYATEFPPVLLERGITSGQVRAVLAVDADDRLSDCLIVACTHPELATDLLGALRTWSFEAPRQRGEAVGVRFEAVFNYEARGIVLTITGGEAAHNAITRWIEAEPVSLVCLPRDLDQPLTALRTVSPGHPGASLRPALATGQAVIDFYVDGEGHTRMPVVVNASHEAFAAAALAALEQWRFTPPTREGKPTLVRVRQTFNFSPRATESHGTPEPLAANTCEPSRASALSQN
jgi:TonB family protein